MDFDPSVPDFRRSGRGNIRHRLNDILILMILARASKCVGRAEMMPDASEENRDGGP